MMKDDMYRGMRQTRRIDDGPNMPAKIPPKVALALARRFGWEETAEIAYAVIREALTCQTQE